MRTVFSGMSEVAHVWAQQTQEEGKAGNVFFHGPTIFSYGHHFPMARFFDKTTILFTTRKYSTSTAKHLNRAWGAIPHRMVNVIKVRNVEARDPRHHSENAMALLNEIVDETKKLRRTFSIEGALRHIEYLRANVQAYADLVGFKTFDKKAQALYNKYVADPNYHGLTKDEMSALEARQERAERAKKEREERQRAVWERRRELEAADAETRLEAWKNGENVSVYGLPAVYLRVKGEEVETSKGARIPLAVAHRLWDRVKSPALALTAVGMSLGYYKVDAFDGTVLTAGCHKIEMAEMQRLAGVLAW